LKSYLENKATKYTEDFSDEDTAQFITIFDLKDLCERAKSRKILGIDWGMVRIGIAVSDALGIVATPLCTLSKQKKKENNLAHAKPGRPRNQQQNQNAASKNLQEHSFIKKITKIVEEEAPVAVVVGLPKNMDGSLGMQAKKVLVFAKELSDRIVVPVLLQDERLSSVAIERSMIEADVTRKKRKGAIDKAAAAFVLQGVIDFMGHDN
jgi:putative Holliday junction resolvase